jgi:hypothetical protein
VENHHAQLAWKLDRLEARTGMNEAKVSKHDQDIDELRDELSRLNVRPVSSV